MTALIVLLFLILFFSNVKITVRKTKEYTPEVPDISKMKTVMGFDIKDLHRLRLYCDSYGLTISDIIGNKKW